MNRIIVTSRIKSMFVDLYCHKTCYANYIEKWITATSISNMLERTIDGKPTKTKKNMINN